MLHFNSALGASLIRPSRNAGRSRPANLSRAEIEVFAGGEDVDRVEKFTSSVSTRVMCRCARDQFLDEHNLIDA